MELSVDHCFEISILIHKIEDIKDLPHKQQYQTRKHPHFHRTPCPASSPEPSSRGCLQQCIVSSSSHALSAPELLAMLDLWGNGVVLGLPWFGPTQNRPPQQCYSEMYDGYVSLNFHFISFERWNLGWNERSDAWVGNGWVEMYPYIYIHHGLVSIQDSVLVHNKNCFHLSIIKLKQGLYGIYEK